MRIGIDCRKIADFGIGTYVRGLVHALADLEGVDEEYVLFVPSPIESPFEQVTVNAPNYSVRELVVLGRAIARARLDLFHSPHFVLPWTSCSSIVTIHDVIPVRFPPPQPGGALYYNVMLRRALRKSVRVLTVSESAKQAIVEAFPCDPSKIAVTPNGIDAIFFARGPAATDLGPYFLFVGNDKPHKNVGTLVDAFRAIEGARLVLVGAGFARYRDVPGIVTTGFVTIERLAELYRGALALVMPSLEEGFGLPVAEAMACGTPVIASDIPSLREVAGDAALYFDAGRPGGGGQAILPVPPKETGQAGLPVLHLPSPLSERMAEIAGDAGLRAQLAERGRTRAARFTWRRCAELTREAYLR
jgi:glycosyltransferase involved in cell wall biosynthesis